MKTIKNFLPVLTVAGLLFCGAGCADSEAATVLRTHPVETAAVVNTAERPVFTFAAATRDEPGFDTVYASYESYLASLPVETITVKEPAYTEELFLSPDSYSNQNLYIGEDGRLIFLGPVDTVYGENDYLTEYYLFMSDGAETERVGPALGYHRQQGESAEYEWVAGFLFVDDGRLLVVNRNQNDQVTYSLYDQDFNRLTEAESWVGPAAFYSSMSFYGNRIFYIDDSCQPYVTTITGKRARFPMPVAWTSGFFINENGLLQLVGGYAYNKNAVYYVYDLTAKKQRAYDFNASGLGIYRTAHNPTDDCLYVIGHDEIGRLTMQPRSFEPLLALGEETQAAMRRGKNGEYINDGFVIDGQGRLYMAVYGDSGTAIWRYTPIQQETAEDQS